MQLRSTKQKRVKGSLVDVAEETDSLPPIRLPKATLGQKKVEVIVTKKAGKVTMGGPSVITIQDSSDSDYILEETNASDEHGKIIDGSSSARFPEEQAPYTHKHKAKCQDSLHAVKRAASSADKSTRQLSKGIQGSSQTQKARFRIDSLLDTDSSGDDEPKTNNSEGHESQMSETLSHPATCTATHLSTILHASEDAHLNACKSSHIKSVFVRSVDHLQQHSYCTLHLQLRCHEALKMLNLMRISCRTQNPCLSAQWTLCSDATTIPSAFI